MLFYCPYCKREHELPVKHPNCPDCGVKTVQAGQPVLSFNSESVRKELHKDLRRKTLRVKTVFP